MKWFARQITKLPYLYLGVLLALTLVALHGVVNLRTGELRISIDPALDRLLPDDDDERRFYDHARKLFGSDEFMLLVLDGEDVFQPAMLEKIQRVTRRLEGDSDVLKVVSLSNAVNVVGHDGEIEVGTFYKEIPQTPAQLTALRASVANHPLYGNALVSKDGRATAIAVFFEHMDDRDFVKRDVSGRLANMVRKEVGGSVLVTGSPHIKAELSRTIVSELTLILPLVAFISAGLCYIAFRSIRGVLLPISAIAMSLIWTLGAMGWTGTPLNLVSNIIPPLLITLGFAASIHMMSEYYEVLHHKKRLDRAGNTEAIITVLEEMGLAMLVNGVTTVLGFLSLCSSNVRAIQEFGFWSVIGICAATLTSLVFIPAVLMVIGSPKSLHPRAEEGRLEKWVERVAEFDIRNRKGIFAGVFVILIFAGIGIYRIDVSSSLVGSFVADSPIRTTFEKLNDRLGGLNSFFLVVEGDENDTFSKPENLRELRKLQDWLEAQPEIGSTASLTDGVKLLNRAFRDNAEDAFSVPPEQSLVKELLFLGGDTLTTGLVDGHLRTANIMVRAKISESQAIGNFMVRLQTRIDQLPRRLTAHATGDLVVLSHTMDAITENMLWSDLTAFITIYLTLSLMLTSFKIGLYALIPNLVPVALYYGALGLTGTPLDLSTSLIGVITLGIAVDDTVHYFTRFALEARRLGNEKLAAASTLRSVFRPVTFTTVGLCLGFFALCASQLRTQVEFGVLSAFTMAIGWLLELMLSPAICSGIRIVTLWDLLTLDLGDNPHLSIPLFRGLSKRQARTFALMSSAVALPTGSRLFSEGEKGEDMYVVIEGTLSAGLARDGQRVDFGQMHRGDVVGEVALFAPGRSADVDVTEDVRLLRFGEKELERVRRRYPAIAAVVYANLGRVLASRITNTIQKLR